MAADELTVDLYATSGGFGSLGELLAQNRTPARTIDLDVMSDENAHTYWERDERFDFAVSLNRGRPALTALCRVLERWIAHFLLVDVAIVPQREINDSRWVWHVGLDAEASSLLNDLYNRVDVAERPHGAAAVPVRAHLRRSRRRCAPRSPDAPSISPWRWIYEQRLRLKPQNLLLNLPLARPQ